MPAIIRGFGGSVPAGSISMDQAADFAARTSAMPEAMHRKVHALYRKAGISKRGSVLINPLLPQKNGFQDFYSIATDAEDRGPTTADRLHRFQREAPALASNAANDALTASSMRPESITHLITVTCTGFYAPGLDIDLINQLKLSPSTERIQVGFMGCHASINAFRVAQALCESDATHNVLVCCVELCSLHYQYGMDTDSIVSNAIFADGASALVISGTEADAEGEDTETRYPESNTEKLGIIAATGSVLVANSTDAMTWRIGNHGFCMTLSAEVPDLITSQLRTCIEPWLAHHGLTIQEVNGWAIHPGGSRILNAAQQSLDLNHTQIAPSRSVLYDHGNMSSATLPFILNRLSVERVEKPWVMLGFGPGLEIEIALIR
jgi:predicted naringenin-chalcone synthase